MKVEIHLLRPLARQVSRAIALLVVSCLSTLAQPNPDNAPKRPQPPLDSRRGDRLPFVGPQWPGRLKSLPPFEGGDPRPELRRDDRPRGDRPQRGPRDELDLPPPPKPN